MSDVQIEDRATPTAVPAATSGSPVTVALGGAFIVVCAMVAVVAELLAGPELGQSREQRWGYVPMMWPLLLALATAGGAIILHPRWARATALLAAVVAAHLAGLGLIAVRAWFHLPDPAWLVLSVTPITYATAMVIAASAATVAAVALAWREPVGGLRSLVPARPALVAAGLVVLVVLPPVWNAGNESGDLTNLREHATLAWSLPWGAGLAAAGWMRGRSGRAAGLLVAAGLVLWVLAVAVVHLRMNLYPPTPD